MSLFTHMVLVLSLAVPCLVHANNHQSIRDVDLNNGLNISRGFNTLGFLSSTGFSVSLEFENLVNNVQWDYIYSYNTRKYAINPDGRYGYLLDPSRYSNPRFRDDNYSAFTAGHEYRLYASAAGILINAAGPPQPGGDPPVLPPVIRTFTGSLNVVAGSSPSIGATIHDSGTPPFTYKWERWQNGSYEIFKEHTSDSRSETLSFSQLSVKENNSYYRLTVSNSAGFSESSLARLTVTGTPPLITQQPQTVIVNEGDTAQISVAAIDVNGFALSYEWYRQNGTKVEGANGPALTIPNIQYDFHNNGIQYRAHVTSLGGTTLSYFASIVVSPPPVEEPDPDPTPDPDPNPNPDPSPSDNVIVDLDDPRDVSNNHPIDFSKLLIIEEGDDLVVEISGHDPIQQSQVDAFINIYLSTASTGGANLRFQIYGDNFSLVHGSAWIQMGATNYVDGKIVLRLPKSELTSRVGNNPYLWMYYQRNQDAVPGTGAATRTPIEL